MSQPYTRATTEKHRKMEGDQEITLKEEKVKHIDPNHDDTLVISDRIINVLVKRVMIDR